MKHPEPGAPRADGDSCTEWGALSVRLHPGSFRDCSCVRFVMRAWEQVDLGIAERPEQRFRFALPGGEGPQVLPPRSTSRARFGSSCTWCSPIRSIAATDPPPSFAPTPQTRPRHATGGVQHPRTQVFSDRYCGWLWIASITCVFRNCERSPLRLELARWRGLVTEKCPNDHSRWKPDLAMGGAGSWAREPWSMNGGRARPEIFQVGPDVFPTQLTCPDSHHEAGHGLSLDVPDAWSGPNTRPRPVLVRRRWIWLLPS
jgi:hypothetical protein